MESLISVPGQKTKILPDIRLLSRVFHCQDFLNRRRKPESKALPEMSVQYEGALKEMNNLALRFFWSPEFKNLTAPTLMTSKGNWGANGSNSIDSTNIHRALLGQVLYRHRGYEIQFHMNLRQTMSQMTDHHRLCLRLVRTTDALVIITEVHSQYRWKGLKGGLE